MVVVAENAKCWFQLLVRCRVLSLALPYSLVHSCRLPDVVTLAEQV